MENPVSTNVAMEAQASGAEKKAGTSLQQFVGFSLAEVDYAFEIRRIQEIILMPPVTRIPQMPDWIDGLINLRGSVIPVVNMRKRFELEPRASDEYTRIIVLNHSGKTIGVVVDSVSRVIKLTNDEIQPPPVTINSQERACLQGVAKVDDRLVVILDVDRLLMMEGLKNAMEVVNRPG